MHFKAIYSAIKELVLSCPLNVFVNVAINSMQYNLLRIDQVVVDVINVQASLGIFFNS